MIDCCRFRWRPPAVRVTAVAASLLLNATLGSAPASSAGDEDFALRHPRLLFSASELPVLRARVVDGGADDDAYTFIRTRATDVYLGAPFDSLLRNDAALEPMINLVLASHFEADVDSALVNLGRRLTLHIARNWGVDTDPFGTSLRLRAMSLGFDHFFVNATAAERDEIRAEAESYIAYMTTNLNFDIWLRRPYVSNKTAMVSGALGLAGICFQDELSASATDAALSAAHEFFLAWRDTHLADDGCYREGSLYVGWSTRNLIYYFAARKRFDGYDYALDPALRAIERWVPYELDPRGDGRVNNIQDQTDYFRPLARHTTYWAWAQSEWDSGIAAYVWEHAAGALGKDMGDENDKASTVLWHRGIPPVNPGTVLERSRVWEDRGLYYFRSGWPDGATSDDVVFSFYSGEFRGGHAQEEQNQFTLAAYGEKLVLDQGAGGMGKQSEAHNLVRIDGSGQHNAGGSIGTDGRLSAYVTSEFSDYVCGDATLAYSTHSPYNNPGVPYPWSDWSWGLTGANPVEYAYRRMVAVHGAEAPPYFVVRDDVRKDGAVHHYDWTLHLPASSTIDTGAEPIQVSTGGASLRVFRVYPERESTTVAVTTFDNGNEDPNSRLLMVGADAVNPAFTTLLLPLPAGAAPPEISRDALPGATHLKLGWVAGIVDEIVVRAPVEEEPLEVFDPFPWAIDTDGALVVVRKDGPSVIGYTLVEGTFLMVGAVLFAAVEDGPASMVFDGGDVHVSREDAQFRVRADAVSGVYYHGQPLPIVRDGEFWIRAQPTGVPRAAAPGLALRAYPNPFNPSVRITFVNPARGAVHAAIHDAAGRLVKTLVARAMDAGPHALQWDGRGDDARAAASGVYFLSLRAGGRRAAAKLILLR